MEAAQIERLLGEGEDTDRSLYSSRRQLILTDFSQARNFLEGPGFTVGGESEYFLEKDGSVPSARKRDDMIEDSDIEGELGASMVEVISDPQRIESLETLEESIRSGKQRAAELAEENGMSLISGATHPMISLEGDIPMSESEDGRYEALIGHYSEHGPDSSDISLGGTEPINPRAPAMSAAIHSNFQAGSMEEAVVMADYLLDIEPITVALAGNCESFGTLETDWNDARMVPWEESFNTEEDPDKVGLPDKYYSERGILAGMSLVFDPGEDVEDPPKQRLDAAIGENWADARIKFYYDEDLEDYGLNHPTAVVEARLASMQDTPKMETAVHSLRAGMLAYKMKNDVPLLGIDKTRENRENAMRNGPDAESYHVLEETPEGYSRTEAPAGEALEEMVDRAREGLDYLGVDDDGYLDLLGENVEG